jgi:hypothetical protein
MAADFRQLHPHGHFFLHWPHGDFSKAYLDEVAAEKTALMAGRCRIPPATIRRWMQRETRIDAKRALARRPAGELHLGMPRAQAAVDIATILVNAM